MNVFESGIRKNIPAVLIYAFRNNQVLMIHRTENQLDTHLGKFNGLGGKSEPGESPQQTAQREFAEESGIDAPLTDFKPIGILNFPNFKPNKNEDWTVQVFIVDLPLSAEPISHNTEGTLHWIPEKQLLDLTLWDGDMLFLPYVLAKKAFTGTLWYESGHCVRSDLLFF